MTVQPDSGIPKLFVSYSWTTPEHEAWVLKLAEELVASGVHVILDKWDLREGNDSHPFMEQMVSDPTITKVAMICDRAYVAKADGRKGGVGTETQIITPQIFNTNPQQQDKYVAVVREHDEQGNPCRPVYFGARIFIDFTDDSDYAKSFEQLVRWIYGKPVYTRPPLGKRPAFLEEGEAAVKLSIAPTQMRAVEALRNGKTHAVPALREFLENVVQELERIKVDLEANPFDEAVVAVAREFQPYRNTIVDVFIAVAAYRNDHECWEVIHRFFERLIPLLNFRGSSGSYKEWDFDHFRIIVQELFLYLVAANIKYERFDAVRYHTRTPYYAGKASLGSAEPMQMFTVFQEAIRSLEARNTRINSGQRVSPLGDILHDQAVGSAVSFDDVMAADFILYFLSRTIDMNTLWNYWAPHSLVYLGRHDHRLEIFVRCRSTAYFDRLKGMLGVADKGALKETIAVMEADPQMLPRWSFTCVRAGSVMNLEAIGTMP